jgi:hypothetical protein
MPMRIIRCYLFGDGRSPPDVALPHVNRGAGCIDTRSRLDSATLKLTASGRHSARFFGPQQLSLHRNSMTPTFRLAPVAVIVMLAGAAVPSAAQVAAPGAAPVATSPAKKELVKKALQLQQAGIESIGVAMSNQAAGQLLQIVTPAITRLPEDKRKAVATEMQAEVRKFQGEVTPVLRASATKWAPSTLGTALEEKLTEDELKTLVTWLESPVSRKYHQISGEAQQALTQKIVAETRPQIEPKLKALEQAMMAKLKAASAAPAASAPKPADAPPKK